VAETIELKTADGAKIGAYKAIPDSVPKGGIVVVQEIFGVNHHIRAVADRFAAEGYLTISPAIFDRAEKGVELAYDDAGMTRGMALAKKISPDQYFLSIEATIEALATAGPIGIVGFCLGGTLAFAAAARSEFLSAAVGYYGGGIADMAGAELNCPVALHFGTKDPHIPAADVEKIKAAYPEVPVYTYPAGHGFNCDERGSYDQPSAALAWTRTLSFLEHNFGVGAL
jgi:carboxymethylenebutenolidase